MSEISTTNNNTRFVIDAEIDGESKVIIKRSQRSIIANVDGVVYINNLGINAENVDFGTERVITLRVRPVR